MMESLGQVILVRDICMRTLSSCMNTNRSSNDMKPCDLIWWVGSMDEIASIILPGLSRRFNTHQSTIGREVIGWTAVDQ